MNFYDFPERNSTVLQRYLTDKINHGIRSKEKAFEPELINNFVTSLGWDFQLLNEYVHNINSYQSIPSNICDISLSLNLQIKILLQQLLKKNHKELLHMAILQNL